MSGEKKAPKGEFPEVKKKGVEVKVIELKLKAKAGEIICIKSLSFPTVSQGNNPPNNLHPRHHSYPRAGHSAFTFCTPALPCDRRNFTLIAKTNGLFPVSCFYTRVKMSVLFDFYGATGMAHQHHMPAEQMFLVSVKGGCVLCSMYCLVFMTGS